MLECNVHVNVLMQSSWKCKLRDRFKFLRRPTGQEPPGKKPRQDDDGSFDTNVANLQEEMKKRKRDRNIATIQTLTTETFSGRRAWIKEEQPPVSDVLLKFPSLKMRKVVRFALILNPHVFTIVFTSFV